jgi:phenylacetate-CoA ligase
LNFSYQFKRTQDVIRAVMMLIKLNKRNQWTREKLEYFQRQQLSSLVSYATRYSPFYQELYKNIRIDQAIVLSDLPMIDKATMMENFDRFVTDPRLKLMELQTHIRQLTGDEYYLGKYRVVTTSGSSGLKGVFVFNRKEWSTILAGHNRCSLSMDISLRFTNRLKESTIWSGNPLHYSYRGAVSGQIHLINSQRLSATSSIESHVNALNTFQPEILSAYPSIASLLAIEQIEGRLNIHPRAVVTAAEMLTKEMELNIQKAWGVNPFDLYGTTEGGAFNIDCPFHRGIHISEDLTIIEVVDEKNQPVPAGSPGYKLLITNLFNYTQPLIRYEVSDMLTISKEPCPCGRPFRLIAKVEGRNDDIIYLPNTRGRDIPVHPIHFLSALGVIKEIKEYRVVHEDKGMTISVVLRKEASGDGVADEIKANLEKSFKTLDVKYLDIRVRFIDKIERDPNAMGKVKLVQSNVKRDKKDQSHER